MFKRLVALAALSMVAIFAQPHSQKPPAVDTLLDWLTAYNTNGRNQLQTFLKKYEPTISLDKMLEFRAATGALELVSIDKIERTHIEFHVRQLATSRIATGELDLTNSVPSQIIKFNFIGLDVIQKQ
jgi:hypothetical protein